MDGVTETRTVELPHGHGTRYCVIGPRMAVDFHFSKLNGYDVLAGLESHYKQCPSYMEGKKPVFDKCWLTGAPCWCDGTSLYASEYLYPLFEALGVDAFWDVLREEHDRRDRDAFGEPVKG